MGAPGTTVHTDGNAVPPLDDDLDGALYDTACVHPGIDLIRDGLRLIATDRLTTDQTQTILATLTGSNGVDIVTALALTVQRLTCPDSNPCLRDLPMDRQQQTRQLGEQYTYLSNEFTPRPYAAEACGLIDGI